MNSWITRNFRDVSDCGGLWPVGLAIAACHWVALLQKLILIQLFIISCSPQTESCLKGTTPSLYPPVALRKLYFLFFMSGYLHCLFSHTRTHALTKACGRCDSHSCLVSLFHWSSGGGNNKPSVQCCSKVGQEEDYKQGITIYECWNLWSKLNFADVLWRTKRIS